MQFAPTTDFNLLFFKIYKGTTMILDLAPTTVELIMNKAKQAGVTADELLVSTFAQDDEDAYYDWFYEHHFDIERLTKAIGETDDNGRAKNTVSVPKGLAKDKEAFRAWTRAKNTRRVPDWALADLASFDKWLAGSANG